MSMTNHPLPDVGAPFDLGLRDGRLLLQFDRASGRGVVETTGTTRFRFAAHDIDMAYGNWTYDLAAATPKSVALVERD